MTLVLMALVYIDESDTGISSFRIMGNKHSPTCIKTIQVNTVFFSVRRYLGEANFDEFSRFSRSIFSQETRLRAAGLYRVRRPVGGLQFSEEISLGRLETASGRARLFVENEGR